MNRPITLPLWQFLIVLAACFGAGAHALLLAIDLWKTVKYFFALRQADNPHG